MRITLLKFAWWKFMKSKLRVQNTQFIQFLQVQENPAFKLIIIWIQETVVRTVGSKYVLEFHNAGTLLKRKDYA